MRMKHPMRRMMAVGQVLLRMKVPPGEERLMIDKSRHQLPFHHCLHRSLHQHLQTLDDDDEGMTMMTTRMMMMRATATFFPMPSCLRLPPQRLLCSTPLHYRSGFVTEMTRS